MLSPMIEASPVYTIGLTTAPDEASAQQLAKCLLEEKLAACVNIIPSIQSHYWWQGKIESANEWLLIVKTLSSHQEAIKEVLVRHHPYDVPELLFLPIADGLEKYLQWIKAETR